MDLREYDTLRKEKAYKRVVNAEKKDQEIYRMLPIYGDAILLGDSLAESILDFRLLRKNNVLAKRGSCIDMIDEELQRIFILEPRYLFMEFGKNDISHFHGSISSFIDAYTKKITYIQKNLPRVTIFINSIIPMKQSVLNRIGGKQVVDQFNHALQEMCDNLQIGFVDNSNLMAFSDEEFEFDGIHPKYPYYAKWLEHMAEIAGIMQK